MLLFGCYTESFVAREKSVPDDARAYFYLRDGSYIRAYADHHRRVEGGYQVSGTIFKKGSHTENFEGLIPDSEIERFGVNEFNLIGTAVMAFITTFAAIGAVLAASRSSYL